MKLTMVEVFTPCKLTSATNQGLFIYLFFFSRTSLPAQHWFKQSLLSYKIIKTKLLPLGIIWDIQTSTKSSMLPSNPLKGIQPIISHSRSRIFHRGGKEVKKLKEPGSVCSCVLRNFLSFSSYHCHLGDMLPFGFCLSVSLRTWF